jgi:predicted RNA-binding Zn-ribbon protein involved in translation (DUF1610 family)
MGFVCPVDADSHNIASTGHYLYMIVRSTRHTLKFANTGKKDAISTLLAEWRRVMQLFCDDIWSNGYTWLEDGVIHEFNPDKYKYELPKYLDYNRFKVDTWLSARMLSSLVTQLSGKLRAICSKNAARLYVFDKEAGQGHYLEHLWETIESKKPSRPDLSDAGIEISSKCAEFIPTPNGEFYGFLRIKSTGLPIFNVPVCHQKHLSKYADGTWTRCNGYLIDEYGVQLRWEKEVPVKTDGIKVGADQGLLTCVSLSDGQTTSDMIVKAPRKNDPDRVIKVNLDTITDKLARKKKGSKAFGRAQTERKNYINYAIKRLDFSHIKEIGLEKITNINYGRNPSRKMKHWSNPEIVTRLAQVAEEFGVRINLQSNAYRSQRCSGCGHVLKKARKGKLYICPICGLVIDADINAAKNHAIDLPAIPHSNEFSRLAKAEGFFWLPNGLFKMDGSELRVPDTIKSQ